MSDVQEFDRLARRLDQIVRQLEAVPFPQIRQAVFAALEALDQLHRLALTRLVTLARAEPALWERLSADPVVRELLALYDLIAPSEPADDPLCQVEQALAPVRAYIQAHGGTLEVVGVSEGVVQVRLAGACVGCPGSAVTVRRGIEQALRQGLPGFRGLVVLPPTASPQPAPRRPRWQTACRVEEVPEGGLRDLILEGQRLVLCRVEGEVYALRDACPGSILPLHLGRLVGPVLTCPWHGCRYDVRTGRRLDRPDGERLEVLPVAVQEGVVLVGFGVPAGAPLERLDDVG